MQYLFNYQIPRIHAGVFSSTALGYLPEWISPAASGSRAGRKGFQMQKAEWGKIAKVHYTMKLASGQVVGSSRGGMPLEFRLGKGKVLKALENAVVGMEVGQSRTVEVAPADGYGLRNEKNVLTLPKTELPKHMEVKVGRTLQYVGDRGETVNLMVIGLTEETVTLDGNHPLAGETLSFDVSLVAVF